MDPVRFKKILVLLLKILVVLELINAFQEGLNQQQWARFGLDLILAGVLYVLWERITIVVRTRKEEYRKKMERSSEQIKMWDALIFSLLWSDQIYRDIPSDRRRLVVISYTLIALGLVAGFYKIGTGLMPLVISGALVLGAVNLVIWVVALERGAKESLQTELRLARDVQISLMPKGRPDIPGCDIAGVSVPAREVGGDFFDYTSLGTDGRHTGIAIFDVSGKGMHAAMSAVFTSGAFASEAKKSSSPAQILTEVNKAVYTHSRRGHFVAFLLAAFDAETRVLKFANAGQTRPLLRSNGTVKSLDAVGVHFPLGMKDDSVYEERCVELQPGDAVFFFTDGFTDAMNDRKEQFGLERMEALIQNPVLHDLSSQRMIEFVSTEVNHHVGGAPQHDDMTMVVIRIV